MSDRGAFALPVIPMPYITCNNSADGFPGENVNDGKHWTKWVVGDATTSAEFTFVFDAPQKISKLYIDRHTIKDGTVDIVFHDAVSTKQTEATDVDLLEHAVHTHILIDMPSVTKYRNLFSDSENLSSLIWRAGSDSAITADYGAAPDGSMVAARVVGTAGVNWSFGQKVNTQTNKSYHISFWIKSNITSSQELRFLIGGEAADVIVATNTWKKVSATLLSPTNSDEQLFGLTSNAFKHGADVLITDPMVEEYPENGTYYGEYIKSGAEKTQEYSPSMVKLVFKDLSNESSIGYMSLCDWFKPKTNFEWVPGYSINYSGETIRTQGGFPLSENAPHIEAQKLSWAYLDLEDSERFDGIIRKYGCINDFVFIPYHKWDGKLYKYRGGLVRASSWLGPEHVISNRFNVSLEIERNDPILITELKQPVVTGGFDGFTVFLRGMEPVDLVKFLQDRRAPLDTPINVIVPNNARVGRITVPSSISMYQSVRLINNGVIKAKDLDISAYTIGERRFSKRVWGDGYGVYYDFEKEKMWAIYWYSGNKDNPPVTYDELKDNYWVGWIRSDGLVRVDWGYTWDGARYYHDTRHPADPENPPGLILSHGDEVRLQYYTGDGYPPGHYDVIAKKAKTPLNGENTLIVSSQITIDNNGIISGGNPEFGGVRGISVVGYENIVWGNVGTITDATTQAMEHAVLSIYGRNFTVG